MFIVDRRLNPGSKSLENRQLLLCTHCRKSSSRIAPIYGWFTEGFDTPVLQDAKALLDELA
jgi:hypothetical protein